MENKNTTDEQKFERENKNLRTLVDTEFDKLYTGCEDGQLIGLKIQEHDRGYNLFLKYQNYKSSLNEKIPEKDYFFHWITAEDNQYVHILDTHIKDFENVTGGMFGIGGTISHFNKRNYTAIIGIERLDPKKFIREKINSILKEDYDWISKKRIETLKAARAFLKRADEEPEYAIIFKETGEAYQNAKFNPVYLQGEK
ncbi:MAG: hypothetical protein ACP5OG_00130 [Candidatus Nanoarchaeia archaeon]